MRSTKTVIFITLLILIPISIFGQHANNERVRELKSRLFNLPSAPYRLDVEFFGNGYEFCNNSAKHIVKFRLGCVEKKNDELNILTERPYLDVDIYPPTSDEIFCRYWHSNDRFFPGEACSEGKLAVVEVGLADGTLWKLRP
jgi:hypothetical protein